MVRPCRAAVFDVSFRANPRSCPLSRTKLPFRALSVTLCPGVPTAAFAIAYRSVVLTPALVRFRGQSFTSVFALPKSLPKGGIPKRAPPSGHRSAVLDVSFHANPALVRFRGQSYITVYVWLTNRARLSIYCGQFRRKRTHAENVYDFSNTFTGSGLKSRFEYEISNRID
jgi:hypothetical protein